MDFDSALNNFLTAINDGQKRQAQTYGNLKWSDDPSDPNAYFVPVSVENGKRYVRVVVSRGGGVSRSVYCFVDKTDGSILKAAGWKAPAKGKRGSIFDPATYKGATVGSSTGWLYR